MTPLAQLYMRQLLMRPRDRMIEALEDADR